MASSSKKPAAPASEDSEMLLSLSPSSSSLSSSQLEERGSFDSEFSLSLLLETKFFSAGFLFLAFCLVQAESFHVEGSSLTSPSSLLEFSDDPVGTSMEKINTRSLQILNFFQT